MVFYVLDLPDVFSLNNKDVKNTLSTYIISAALRKSEIFL